MCLLWYGMAGAAPDPAPGATVPAQPLPAVTADMAFTAGSSLAEGARETTHGLITRQSANDVLPGYDRPSPLAGTFDPFRLPKAEGSARRQECAEADLARLPENERRECEAINYLGRRVNAARYTLHRQQDPLFRTYRDAEMVAASLANADCRLPVRPDAVMTPEETTCREERVASRLRCRDKLTVNIREREREFDYVLTLNTDLRKWRAFCNGDASGRIRPISFPLHKILRIEGKTYRYVGLDASHQWGYEASCLMEEMGCDQSWCDRNGQCQCINPVPSGRIVPRNEFLRVMTHWGEEDDANIRVKVDLEQGRAEIVDAELRDNGGVIMSWTGEPLQMQGRALMSVQQPSGHFDCAQVRPRHIRVIHTESGEGCESGRSCTVGTAAVVGVDEGSCRVTLLLGRSSGDFHYLHDGWGARWTNRVTLRMLGVMADMEDSWSGQCPEDGQAKP